MPNSIKEPFIDKVCDVYSRLADRKIELLKMVSSIDDEIESVENFDDLLALNDNMQELLTYHFEEDVIKHLEAIAKKIEALKSKIGEIPNTLDEVEGLLAITNGQDVYDRVYHDSLNEVKEKLLKEEQQWITKSLEPAENIDSLDAQQCTLYIDKLRSMPSFVSFKTTKRVRQAIVNVEEKLHECKVQGVLSLFNALSESEKKEFLRIISRL